MKSIFEAAGRFLPVLLLAAALLGGLATRRHVLDAQRVLTADGTIPFTLESALAFRRIQMAYRDGEMPERDRGIQYPDGVVARETDTLGAEMAYARAAKAWPGLMPLAEKIRWLHLLWYSLAIPGIFFWIKWMGGGTAGGAWGAAFYAVAISAVARSTGQELSHENNALPFLLWHLAADAWTAHRARTPGGRLGGGLAAALLAAMALAAWDLTQFYLGLYMARGLYRALRGRMGREELWTRAVPMVAALLAAGARNPYLRAHGFLLSPVLGMGWGMVLAGAPLAQRSRLATRLALGLGPVAAFGCFSGLLAPSYGHFASLFWAKLLHGNVRPADPAELTFGQRILWVPALNSTSWGLLWRWFPALLPLTAAAIWGLLKKQRRNVPEWAAVPFLLFSLLVSFSAFILFFRFHVWVAAFACGTIGLWAGLTAGTADWKGLAAGCALGLGLAAEASQPWLGPLHLGRKPADGPDGPRWHGPLFWGRPNVYAAETEELMEHLRTYVAPEPVLANFGISAGIATYGGCPVVLHPKFETREIRGLVEEYGEALFKGDEAEFKGWMEARGATVYVHSMGEFSEIEPGYQMRYMVDALDPATNAAARLFEQRPEELKHFAPQFANRKYRVYRAKASTTAARLAQARAEEARAALEGGEIGLAAALAAHALRMDAGNADAQETLRVAGNLDESGFRADDEGAAFYEASRLAPADPWRAER